MSALATEVASAPAPEAKNEVVAAAPGVTKKRPAKKAAAKPAKKATKKAAAKKAPKEKGERKERGPSKLQISALKLLSKKEELTRAQISEALEGAFIGGNVMGHVDPAKLVPNSLLGRKLVSVKVYPGNNDSDGPAHYAITAAGRKLLESLK